MFRIKCVQLQSLCVNAIILETASSFVSPDYVCSPFYVYCPFVVYTYLQSTSSFALPTPLRFKIATSLCESLRVARHLPRYTTRTSSRWSVQQKCSRRLFQVGFAARCPAFPAWAMVRRRSLRPKQSSGIQAVPLTSNVPPSYAEADFATEPRLSSCAFRIASHAGHSKSAECCAMGTPLNGGAGTTRRMEGFLRKPRIQRVMMSGHVMTFPWTCSMRYVKALKKRAQRTTLRTFWRPSDWLYRNWIERNEEVSMVGEHAGSRAARKHVVQLSKCLDDSECFELII